MNEKESAWLEDTNILCKSIRRFKKYNNMLKAGKILPPEANAIVIDFIGAHTRMAAFYTDEISIDDHLWCREQIEKAMKDTDPAGKRL